MVRITATAVAALLLFTGAAAADDGEPGDCAPPCRPGFFCKAGKCVSECNPPCPFGQRCVKGDCEPIPRPDRPDRERYLALFGVFHAALTDSAAHMGEIRLEFAGKYSGLQVGPAFGDKVLQLRSAIIGRIPFRPMDHVPLYLVPTIAIGYGFGWIDDDNEGHLQDIFIAPGFRLRYDIIPKLAVVADLMQLQITFLRLRSGRNQDVERDAVVPVTWNLSLGLAFLY
jgi:hypothetical protein